MPFRRPIFAAAVAALAIACFALAGPGGRAEAHPLGNYSVNHYTRIDVSDAGIDIFRVLDLAEFPTVQEMSSIDISDDDVADDTERAAYAESKGREIGEQTIVAINGKRVELRQISQTLDMPPGQGGLATLRLEVHYALELPDNWRSKPPLVELEDRNYSGRLGWREIVARGGQGVELFDSTVPDATISSELLAYPEDRLESPLDVRNASFSFRAGAGAALPTPANEDRAVRGNPDSTLARYADLVAKDDLGIGVMLLALLSAVGFGAIHALSPGHGKTIVAAYLVGSRGTARHALLLGLTVTATHTSSVYALGFITLYLSEYILPERLYPWLGVASGALIVVMGLALFTGRLRSSGLVHQTWSAVRIRLSSLRVVPLRAYLAEGGAMILHHSHGRFSHEHNVRDDHAYVRPHDDEHHDHEDGHSHDDAAHSHGFGPAHSHAIPGQDGEPVTWQRLIGLGIFGGLLPCPSAIVVMLSAISLHRVAFGLLLIVFFSLGLAGVLTGIGFALVYARTIAKRVPFVDRIAQRASTSDGLTALAIRAFPVLSAAVVMFAGVLVVLNATRQF